MQDEDDDDSAEGKGRVLRFDPKVRERRGARTGATGAQGGPGGSTGANGKGPGPLGSPSRGAGVKGRVQATHTTRFKIFRGLEIAGVVFVMIVFLRSCSLGF